MEDKKKNGREEDKTTAPSPEAVKTKADEGTKKESKTRQKAPKAGEEKPDVVEAAAAEAAEKEMTAKGTETAAEEEATGGEKAPEALSETSADQEKQKPKGGLPKWLIPLLSVAAAVLVGWFVYPRLFPETPRQQADKALANRQYATAANLYQELYEANPDDDELAALSLVTLLRHQDFNAALTLYTYNIQPRLEQMDPQAVEQMQPAIDILDAINQTAQVLEETYAEDPVTWEAALRARSEEPGVNQGFVEYLVATYMTDDEDRITQLLGETYAKESQLHFVLPYKASFERRKGNFDVALEDYKQALQEDKENVEALRGMAILTMLTGGSKKGALQYATQAYELQPNGSYVADTLAMVYIFRGETDKAEALIAEMEANPYVGVDEDLRQYLAGEKTLEDIYIGGAA